MNLKAACEVRSFLSERWIKMRNEFQGVPVVFGDKTGSERYRVIPFTQFDFSTSSLSLQPYMTPTLYKI